LQSFHFQLAEIAQFDFRIDFEHRNKLDILAFFQRLWLDAWLASRFQLLFADGVIKALAHHFAQDFLAYALAETSLDDAHRHLALAETIKANIAGSFLQTGRYSTFDNGSGHSDRHTAFKARCGLNRNLHEISSYLNEMPSS